MNRLPVHEENNQNIVFEEGHLNAGVLNLKDTALMAYFKAVTQENNLPIPPNDGRPLASDLTYAQFPKSFSFRDGKWVRRKYNLDQIGRMYAVFPSAGERFYIRMLLCQVTTVFFIFYLLTSCMLFFLIFFLF